MQSEQEWMYLNCALKCFTHKIWDLSIISCFNLSLLHVPVFKTDSCFYVWWTKCAPPPSNIKESTLSLYWKPLHFSIKWKTLNTLRSSVRENTLNTLANSPVMLCHSLPWYLSFALTQFIFLCIFLHQASPASRSVKTEPEEATACQVSFWTVSCEEQPHPTKVPAWAHVQNYFFLHLGLFFFSFFNEVMQNFIFILWNTWWTVAAVMVLEQYWPLRSLFKVTDKYLG